jgi:endonuclease/exonuclease/phosphatase family metal-dependent hydrolase
VSAALTVVSWNMHGGAGDLEAMLQDLETGTLSGGNPGERLLLLQEARGDGDQDVRRIAERRGLSAFFGAVHHRDHDGSGAGVAIGNAIVSSRPLVNPRAIDLPRERQRRAAVLADIEVGGRTLLVASTHLENRLGWLQGFFGDRARGRQARALLDVIPPGQPGILGGDMNTMLGPDEPAWRAFLGRFPDTPDSPQPTFRDRLVLDHLFFDLPDGWRATQQVIRERYGSDHHPVLAVVTSG